jgi:hypothetical protein
MLRLLYSPECVEGVFSEVRCSKRPLAREALPAPRLPRTQTSENDEYPTWGV